MRVDSPTPRASLGPLPGARCRLSQHLAPSGLPALCQSLGIVGMFSPLPSFNGPTSSPEAAAVVPGLLQRY